jgi:hypothetical protein
MQEAQARMPSYSPPPAVSATDAVPSSAPRSPVRFRPSLLSTPTLQFGLLPDADSAALAPKVDGKRRPWHGRRILGQGSLGYGSTPRPLPPPPTPSTFSNVSGQGFLGTAFMLASKIICSSQRHSAPPTPLCRPLPSPTSQGRRRRAIHE